MAADRMMDCYDECVRSRPHRGTQHCLTLGRHVQHFHRPCSSLCPSRVRLALLLLAHGSELPCLRSWPPLHNALPRDVPVQTFRMREGGIMLCSIKIIQHRNNTPTSCLTHRLSRDIYFTLLGADASPHFISGTRPWTRPEGKLKCAEATNDGDCNVDVHRASTLAQ